ncbi:hypothetical protein ACN27F_06780 [Solwaraspora sp. WMMB335]|uniref:hypothetical protein n=1 Tax=Solwaraspora sp. WMMB335 TaxID=3404118 RepID=UPI003B95FC9D
MIQITAADEELFATVLAATRLGRADAIVERLSEQYEKDWQNPLAGFPYALSMVAKMQVTWANEAVDEGQALASYSEIIESLGDLLYGEPDHWLGRYLRVRIRTMMMPPDHLDHPRFVTDERARAADDARELIERQAGDDWRPWFACPYLLAARLAWESDGRDPAEVARLVATAAARPASAVPFRALGGILSEGFVWYDSQPDLPERGTARRLARALFAGQRAVRAAAAPAAAS